MYMIACSWTGYLAQNDVEGSICWKDAVLPLGDDLTPIRCRLSPSGRYRKLQVCYHNCAQFSATVLLLEKACFTREGVVRTHKRHMWSSKNLPITVSSKVQYKFSVNIWAGILRDHLKDYTFSQTPQWRSIPCLPTVFPPKYVARNNAHSALVHEVHAWRGTSTCFDCGK